MRVLVEEPRGDSITSKYRELELTETRCTLERGPWPRAANKDWPAPGERGDEALSLTRLP